MTIAKIETNLKALFDSKIEYDSLDIPLEVSGITSENFPNLNNNVKIFPSKLNKAKTKELQPKSLVVSLNLNKSFRTQILISSIIQLDGLRELINNPELDKIIKYLEKVNTANNGIKIKNQTNITSKSIFS